MATKRFDNNPALQEYAGTESIPMQSMDGGTALDDSTIAPGDDVKISLSEVLGMARDGMVHGLSAGAGVSIDNTDPSMPVISVTTSGGGVAEVVAGTGVSVDSTDPERPIVSATAGGLTLFQEASSSTGINSSVPVNQIRVVGVSSGIDLCISPKGAGAILAQLPDGLAAGGDKRGASAVDLQLIRSMPNQVASGTRSFCAGWNNRASAQGSAAVGGGNSSTADGAVSLGNSNSASAESAFAAGKSCNASGIRSISLGDSSTADAAGSVALGPYASTGGVINSVSEGSGSLLYRRVRMTLRGRSTTASTIVLTTDGGSAAASNCPHHTNQNNHEVIYWGTAIARQIGNGGGSKAWRFSVHVSRSSGTGIIVGTPVLEVISDTGSLPWSVSFGVNNSRNTLEVSATGEVAKTINWACQIEGQHCPGA